jgi:hypothetical protein
LANSLQYADRQQEASGVRRASTSFGPKRDKREQKYGNPGIDRSDFTGRQSGRAWRWRRIPPGGERRSADQRQFRDPVSSPDASTSGSASDSTTYATGQPLPTKSNEGFWGKMNPLARKKWVNRQVAPVKDRLNELDQLSAKNANDIKDVDSRAQAGIHQAQSTADAGKSAGDAGFYAGWSSAADGAAGQHAD